MLVIDKEGKIFGKINVIDFLVILFLIIFLSLTYYGYKMFNKPVPVITETSTPEMKKVENEKEFVDIILDCLLIKFDNLEYIKGVATGDKETNDQGQVIAEIIKAGDISPLVREFDIGTSKRLTVVDPTLKQIRITLKLKAEVRGSQLYYKDRQILNNSIIDFTTVKYYSKALVTVKDEGLYDIAGKIDAIDKKLDTLSSSKRK